MEIFFRKRDEIQIDSEFETERVRKEEEKK